MNRNIVKQALLAITLLLFFQDVCCCAQSTKGDINADNYVNTTDVTVLYNVIFGTNVSTPKTICDINGDGGEPNTTDVTELYNIIFGTSGSDPTRFVGGDISLLPTYEEHSANYNDADGNHISDMLSFFADAGWNTMRVRLFVDPSKATEKEKMQGVRQDIEYVKALGKRIKDKGFKLILDIHYSDSWADPAKQYTPDAWASLTDAQLYIKIYDYTKDVLAQMKDAGATPDFIQTGNEISYGMLWGPVGSSSLKKCYYNSTANWERFVTLLKQATKACREECPNAKIILHTERVESMANVNDSHPVSNHEAFYQNMATYNVDYDIVGLSYYPYYHGDTDNLESAIRVIENKFPTKKIMIVETGYFHKYYPNDAKYDWRTLWPDTDAGQQLYATTIVGILNNHSSVTGLFWWFPEANEYMLNWNTQRVTDGWYNASLWDNETGKVLPAINELKGFK